MLFYQTIQFLLIPAVYLSYSSFDQIFRYFQTSNQKITVVGCFSYFCLIFLFKAFLMSEKYKNRVLYLRLSFYTSGFPFIPPAFLVAFSTLSLENTKFPAVLQDGVKELGSETKV